MTRRWLTTSPLAAFALCLLAHAAQPAAPGPAIATEDLKIPALDRGHPAAPAQQAPRERDEVFRAANRIVRSRRDVSVDLGLRLSTRGRLLDRSGGHARLRRVRAGHPRLRRLDAPALDGADARGQSAVRRQRARRAAISPRRSTSSARGAASSASISLGGRGARRRRRDSPPSILTRWNGWCCSGPSGWA